MDPHPIPAVERLERLGSLVERVHRAVTRSDPAAWTSLGASARHRSLADLARRDAPLLGDQDVEWVVDQVIHRLHGLGPLQPLLDDPSVSEVMVNGGGAVWVERAGHVERCPLKLDEPTVGHLIERLLAPTGRRVDRSSPLVDARLADGSRVNAIVRPVAVDGPCLTIRRFGVVPVTLDQFGSAATVAVLRQAVDQRRNIVVSGGTSTGKTTLLNALAAVIDPTERILTIEDTAELRLTAPHVVRLEARPANVDGLGELRIDQLVRNALRMRPDRLIVGEVRGGEAHDMLQAMNTGHDGSLSTCHANSPADALRRIETMALLAPVDLPLAAVREQIRSCIDLVVQVGRQPGGARTVIAVDEVVAEAAAPSDPVATSPLAPADGAVVGFRRPPRVTGAASGRP